MQRFDGTVARQLDLIDPDGLIDRPDLIDRNDAQRLRTPRRATPSSLKLLRQDIYAELTRRRRRAQIAARRWTNES